MHFHLMCMDVLPACVSVHHRRAMPVGTRRGHQTHWNRVKTVANYHMDAGNRTGAPNSGAITVGPRLLFLCSAK